MPILFFVSKGVVHKEFVLEGQTVTKGFYAEVFGCLLKQIACVRSEMWKNRRYTSAHRNNCTAILGKKRRVPVLSHPVYSLDPNTPDYFAFFKIKIKLKGD